MANDRHDSAWSIVCGDAVGTMGLLDDGVVDLTVTSPPYDNLRTYEGSLEWGEAQWKAVLSSLYRVTADGGVVVWVVGDATIDGSETGTSFRQALYAQELGFRLHDTMLYLKDNPPPVGGSNRYYQAFEYMFVFSKGAPKTFNPLTRPRRNKYNDKRTHRVRAVNRDADGNFSEKKLIPMKETVKRENVWRYTVGGGNSVPYGVKHPAAFPLQLAEDHVLSWSDEGDNVLDPFVGSGTTGVAAVANGRAFLGIDKVEEYVEYAKERIGAETKEQVAR